MHKVEVEGGRTIVKREVQIEHGGEVNQCIYITRTYVKTHRPARTRIPDCQKVLRLNISENKLQPSRDILHPARARAETLESELRDASFTLRFPEATYPSSSCPYFLDLSSFLLRVGYFSLSRLLPRILIVYVII